MKRIALIAAVLAPLLCAAAAKAELCRNCRTMSFIANVGKCAQCSGATSSGAHKLCRKCSGKLRQCQNCRAPLGAAGDRRAPPAKPVRPIGPRPVAPQKIDLTKSRDYVTGKWRYSLRITLKGTRSEGRNGRLFHDGKEVPAAQVNDHYPTPWGLMYWVGPRRAAWVPYGWMPHPARARPGNDRKGTLLPMPPGATAPAKPEPLLVGEAHNGKTVRVTIGREIRVALKANPTTGYRWTLKGIQGDAIRHEGRATYSPRPTGRRIVGSGGTMYFRFLAVRPGNATITLIYHRSWEKAKPPARTYTLTVQVAKGAAADPARLAAARAKLLGENPESFTLHLTYFGPQGKPFYSLLLSGAKPRASKVGPRKRGSFDLQVHITKRQVAKIVAHLGQSGHLARAKDAATDAIGAAEGPCYLMRVTGGTKDGLLDLRDDLGWGRDMFKKLDALRAVLFGPSADAMDKLLGRLRGYRKQKV